MRPITVTIALAALLVSGVAGAAGGSGKDPGKGASGPSSPGEGPGASNNEGSSSSDLRDAAIVGKDAQGAKVWEVGASYEYHRLLRSTDLGGAAVNKNVSYVGFYGRWDITPNDRIALRGGVYQRYLADQGETGMRFDDLSLAYTRKIELPAEFTMRASFSLSAPTSYASQKATMYTSPRLSLSVDRRIGKYFTADARVSGSMFIVKCATASASISDAYNCDAAGGASPNPKGILSGSVTADFAMPFHEQLSIGLSGYTGYVWFYDVFNRGGTAPGQMDTLMQPGQPVQQTYGGELYVKYVLPSLAGLKWDLTLALANGDPTLGYTSVIHDGAQTVQFGYRQTAEVYGVFAARY